MYSPNHLFYFVNPEILHIINMYRYIYKDKCIHYWYTNILKRYKYDICDIRRHSSVAVVLELKCNAHAGTNATSAQGALRCVS